ncbi:MAG: hypothetical protein HQ478_08445 [Chloroflexi bacterium]|nr:hypothetical protein [Chloroflexota bacterium]
MKLSAKFVTALAALALVVVAVAGLAGTGSSAQATHGPTHTNATIKLNKAWYNATAVITVTITDKDRDFATAATSGIVFTSGEKSSSQIFDLQDNIADRNSDGLVNSSDLDISNNPVVTVGERSAHFNAVVLDPVNGTVQLFRTVSGAGGDALTIGYNIDTKQTITTGAKIISTQDATGLVLTFTETKAASGGIFTATTTLGALSTTTPSTLKAIDQDTITATFTDDTAASGSTSHKATASAKVETSGPVVDVTSPANKLSTQQRTPTFTVQISDTGSGVDTDTILLNLTALTGLTAGGPFAPSETPTVSGGVVTATFANHELLAIGESNQQKVVEWSVTVKDIAGNSGETDSDAVTALAQKYSITVDRLAPSLASAVTGTIWDTSATTTDKTNSSKDDVNSLEVIFTENLDTVTVSPGDFQIDGVTPVSTNVFSGKKSSVFITMAGAFSPDSKPVVKIVSSIGDTAGNTIATGQIDKDTGSTDGIAPQFTVALDKTLTNGSIKLTVSSDEAIQGNIPVIKIHTPDTADEDSDPLTLTVARTLAGIKVIGGNSWEATVDSTALSSLLNNGKQAVEVTGNDAASNAGKKGGSSATATSAVTFTVDKTAPAVTPFSPLTGASITNNSPFVQVQFLEAVTLTAATFTSGTGAASDVLAALIASSADSKLFVLSPGSYPGSATTLALGDHTIKVSATDAAGNKKDDQSAKFTVTERKDFSLPLVAGWNLVSLPGVPADQSINAVITDSDVNTVIAYDGASGSFTTAVRDAVSGQLTGSLSTIDGTQGLWVNTTSFDPIKVSIPPIAAATLPPTIPVVEGWNLISVINTSSNAPVVGVSVGSIAQYLTGVKYSKVYTYDELNNAFIDMGSLNATIGDGLWVFATAAGTVTP